MNDQERELDETRVRGPIQGAIPMALIKALSARFGQGDTIDTLTAMKWALESIQGYQGENAARLRVAIAAMQRELVDKL